MFFCRRLFRDRGGPRGPLDLFLLTQQQHLGAPAAAAAAETTLAVAAGWEEIQGGIRWVFIGSLGADGITGQIHPVGFIAGVSFTERGPKASRAPIATAHVSFCGPRQTASSAAAKPPLPTKQQQQQQQQPISAPAPGAVAAAVLAAVCFVVGDKDGKETAGLSPAFPLPSETPPPPEAAPGSASAAGGFGAKGKSFE